MTKQAEGGDSCRELTWGIGPLKILSKANGSHQRGLRKHRQRLL
jgi:hypothetical protein